MKSKVFEKALEGFNRKAKVRGYGLRTGVFRVVFAEEIALLEGKSGLVRKSLWLHQVPDHSFVAEPGIAVASESRSLKDGRRHGIPLKDFFAGIDSELRMDIDAMSSGRRRKIGEVAADTAIKPVDVNPLIELRDKESINIAGQGGRAAIGRLFDRRHHSTLAFPLHGKSDKRIMTGMETDLSREGIAEAEVLEMAAALRNGRYHAQTVEPAAKEKLQHENRKVCLLVTDIARRVGLREVLAVRLVEASDPVADASGIEVGITALGQATSINDLANYYREYGWFGGSYNIHGLSAFVTMLAHTLDKDGRLFSRSLVEELYEKLVKEELDKIQEKFTGSFQNILTMLGYGEEVRFEVVAKPELRLGGHRVRVEFICEEPPIKMYEAINPAIFEHAWIDCGEIERIEQKLINKKEEAELNEQKNIPLATRLVKAFNAVGDETPEGFLKPGAKIGATLMELSPRAQAEARWRHIRDIDAKALGALFDGTFSTSCIAGMLKVEIHESQLAFKHRPNDHKLIEVPLAYETAYMMFAEQFLEEVLNQPHFPYPVKAFIRHYHPVFHNLGVVDAVLPILNRIINKTKQIQVVSGELFNHPVLK